MSKTAAYLYGISYILSVTLFCLGVITRDYSDLYYIPMWVGLIFVGLLALFAVILTIRIAP